MASLRKISSCIMLTAAFAISASRASQGCGPQSVIFALAMIISTAVRYFNCFSRFLKKKGGAAQRLPCFTLKVNFGAVGSAVHKNCNPRRAKSSSSTSRKEFSEINFCVFHVKHYPARRGICMVRVISSSESWRRHWASTPAERIMSRLRVMVFRNSRTSLMTKVGRLRPAGA